MFGNQVNILGQMLRRNFLRAHTTDDIPDYLMDKDGIQLIASSIKCPFYDAPSAVANPGLSARFEDVPGKRGNRMLRNTVLISVSSTAQPMCVRHRAT